MAGVPDLSIDDGKSPISIEEFREECDEVLTPRDQKLMFYFYLKQDCLNLVKLLKDPDAEVPLWGNYSMEQYRDLITSAKTMNFNVHRFPAFMSMYARDFDHNNGVDGWFAEDQMMLAFYDYAMKCDNKMIASWYKLNFDLTNILTAFIARKNGWSVGKYILGENELNEQLRTNNAKDFDLPHERDYATDLMRIVEITDPVEKEKRLDAFKWQWLDDQTFFEVFSVEAVFAYLCKLEMLHRWEALDVEQGKETFRQIIENLRGEAKVPAEFQQKDLYRKNKK